MLEIVDLAFSYPTNLIIDGVNLKINKGEFVGLIGPNGCGKSTLLKNVYRTLKPKNGNIYFEDKNIQNLSYKETAKKISVISQNETIVFDFTVEEIVAMGRHPYKKLFDIDTKEEHDFIIKCLDYLGMKDKAKENYAYLSGGEQQRVLLAKAIAQDTNFMILDEPTNHLDIRYQMQIFDLLKNMNMTVFTAIHDLNLATLYCDRLILMDNGKIIKDGSVEEVMTEQNIKEIYKVDVKVYKQETTKKLYVNYIPNYLNR